MCFLGTQGAAQSALERAASALGGAESVLCSLSLAPSPGAGAAPPAGEPDSIPSLDSAIPGRLLISRYVRGRPPLLVSLPLQQLADAADEQQA